MSSRPVSHAVRISPLASHDVPAMLALERASYPVPWSRAMLEAELHRDRGVALGAWHGCDLVGMLLAARLADAWHLLNIAVMPSGRRRGVASQLMDGLVERLRADQLPCTLEVRAANTAARALYGHYDFTGVGVRPRYYPDGEDALIMWRPPQNVLDRRHRGEAVEWEPPA